MLAVVCLKAETRTDIPLRLEEQGRAFRPEDLAPASFDTGRLALQTALALKGKGALRHVLALSVGPLPCEALLREALAAGADEALRVWPDGMDPPRAFDGSATTTRFLASCAAAAIAARNPNLVLMGERSGDTGNECFGAFLAARLGAPFAHRTVGLEPEEGDWRVVVKIERGYTQEMVVPSPAVVTVATRASVAPYASLPGWLAALTAPIPHAACGAPPAPACTTHLRDPVPRVKRHALPRPGLDAEGRIRAMVSLSAAGGGVLLGPEMSPAEQADELARLLRDKGYL
jgi:electron transfer flavoprotein beta subunit